VRTADLRILTATNANLEQSVRAGRFRQDLLYRLNVMEVTLPPLRERGDDVGLLARHFLEKYRIEFDKPSRAFTEEALRKLRFYSWPGNVRELENVVERAVVFSQEPLIHAVELVLPRAEREGDGSTFKDLKAQAIRNFEIS
jgi:DNA-binding NtrC family response regulator